MDFCWQSNVSAFKYAVQDSTQEMSITSLSQAWRSQMSPDIARCPLGVGGTVDPGENYSVQCFGESVSRGWCKPLDSLRCSEGQCGVRAERPALSVPQLQWGTTSRDHQTHQEGGTGGRKEGQAQKKADQGVVCYPHLPLFTCHEHHLSAWTLWPGRDRRVWRANGLSLSCLHFLSPKTGRAPSGTCLRESCGDYMCLCRTELWTGLLIWKCKSGLLFLVFYSFSDLGLCLSSRV